MADFRFPPAYRLRSKQDFSSFRNRRSRRVQMGNILIRWVAGAQPESRIGLAVSRKYGKSVYRNKAKRQLRHVFRTHEIKYLGVDILVILQKTHKDTKDLMTDFSKALDSITDQLAKA